MTHAAGRGKRGVMRFRVLEKLPFFIV